MESKILRFGEVEQSVSTPLFCTQLPSAVKETFPDPKFANLDLTFWKKGMLVMGVMLVFILMLILLFWNYKCIVIDQFCEGIDEFETPIFREDKTS